MHSSSWGPGKGWQCWFLTDIKWHQEESNEVPPLTVWTSNDQINIRTLQQMSQHQQTLKKLLTLIDISMSSTLSIGINAVSNGYWCHIVLYWTVFQLIGITVFQLKLCSTIHICPAFAPQSVSKKRYYVQQYYTGIMCSNVTHLLRIQIKFARLMFAMDYLWWMLSSC